MFAFKVTHQKLMRVDSFYAVAESRNYLTAHFELLSDEWKNTDATITAFFRGRNFNEPAVVAADGMCKIPNVAAENSGRVYVSLRYIDEAGVEIPTNEVVIDLDATGSQEPTDLPDSEPSVYAQLVTMATEAKNIAASVREDADNGVFDGEKGDKGDAGIQGPQGEKGDSGYTPVKGDDYFTPAEIQDIVNSAAAKALPEITLEEADSVYEGIYKVSDEWGDDADIESYNRAGILLCEVYTADFGPDAPESTHEVTQLLIRSNGDISRRTNKSSGINDHAAWEGWTGWRSVIPGLAGYAKTSDVDTKVDEAKQYADEAISVLAGERKLKLLKTITLEEDVASIKAEFDKPLDEIAILLDAAFLTAETKAIAAHADGGGWYMFWVTGAMKTTNQYFFAHAREYGEARWECIASGGFFGSLQGISASTTTPKYILSRRLQGGNIDSRYLENLNIFIPNNTTENAFAAGSTIEIWGHEADESI